MDMEWRRGWGARDGQATRARGVRSIRWRWIFAGFPNEADEDSRTVGTHTKYVD
jgi:hypothetical protein